MWKELDLHSSVYIRKLYDEQRKYPISWKQEIYTYFGGRGEFIQLDYETDVKVITVKLSLQQAVEAHGVVRRQGPHIF
jgi:hypothetical protein